MTIEKSINKSLFLPLSKINKSINIISKKTARGAKLTKAHKIKIEKTLAKLYVVANDLEKISIILE